MSRRHAPVIEVRTLDTDNRLSELPGRNIDNRHARILALLPRWPCEHPPGTRDVVEALGLPITRVTMASISRTMDRLWARGLVVGITLQIARRDRRLRWALPPLP